MAERWHHGEPPKDGKIYEARQRYKNAGGQWVTAQQRRVHWDGKIFVRISQLDGKPRGVVLLNRWRKAQCTATTPRMTSGSTW